jgi:hypothetical protein
VASPDQDRSPSVVVEAASYVIVVQGRLDSNWSEYVGGMTISIDAGPDGATVSVLRGELPDQAALFGVLNHLYNLGFRLLLVESNSSSAGEKS